ncbi:Transferase [Penicillium italicum]|uniref:Transferase n=1 Tax=Penicillium italicum TaxID=40296 RepID=A0A0A2L783_PENIT|nr:Transferase [Penicillium italicum]
MLKSLWSLCGFKESGDVVIVVPLVFDSKRPAVRFSHVKFGIRIEEHPLGNRLPKKTGPYPSTQEGCHAFLPLSVPHDLPGDIEHYYTTDEPLIALHVTSFTDATLVSITFPHSVCDVMGTAELLRAWSTILAGQYDCVPALHGASQDVVANVGTSEDEKAEKPYLLEHRQIKGLSLLSFIVRFVWDLLTRRNVQSRTIFLPARYLSNMRETAERQLPVDPQTGNAPFLSDGDLITAWGSQMVMSSSPRKKPAIICNVFDIRRRLKNVFTPGGAYLQNLILPASVLLSAQEKSNISLGQIALHLRQAIIEQTTDSQARRLMRVMKASIKSTGVMPLFGDSASRIIAFTNWSTAKLAESAKFSPAVTVNHHTLSPTVRKSSCVSYWGTTIGKSDNPRDTFVIFGKDDNDNYWVHAYLRAETWDLIDTEFSRYQRSSSST